MKKIISIFFLTTLLLLPLQITTFGDEQCNQEIQNIEESIIETAEGLNNIEDNAKSSDLFWTTSLQLAKTTTTSSL